MENYVEKKESFEDLIKRIKELQKRNDGTLKGGYIALPKPNEVLMPSINNTSCTSNTGCTTNNKICANFGCKGTRL